MSYIIQNIKTNKYLKSTGEECNYFNYPFKYVDREKDAEQYPTLEHAEYVAFWYADHFEKWRVIDEKSGKSYIDAGGNRWRLEQVGVTSANG